MHAIGQPKHDSCCIAKSELIGVWQRDTRKVGDGLGQNIQFFGDGRFVINLGNQSDDARMLIGLKGRYRLVKNELYITILSRKVVEGGYIEIDDPGISFSIFSIAGGKVKEIVEASPVEIGDPLDITVIKRDNIKLGHEVYYKIGKAVLDEIDFSSDK